MSESKSGSNIWIARHNTDLRVTPMLIVDMDPHIITGKVWDTSETVGDIVRDFEYNEIDNVPLDPGGWLWKGIPFTPFTVDGIEFEIQMHQCDNVSDYLFDAPERLPGIKRFGLYRFHYYMKKRTYINLMLKLEQLNKSDASMHAQLDWDAKWIK